VARFSLAVFVEYVFGRAWEEKFEVLVDASWAWRREIAVRGRADASVKRAAVRLVVDDLIRNDERLWAMHGEAWREPRNYSLIMQPFLISPAINVGDVAVALKRRPGLTVGGRHARRAPVSHLRTLRERGRLRRPESRQEKRGRRLQGGKTFWR
jgi:hypothetical protein